MSPTISVIMPVYNTERYVAKAIQSILDQTFRDFEFLIINDGSTDGSLAILERFAKMDTRIQLVSRPNTGIVGALNELLAIARGEFVARMDADDLSKSHRFERQVSFLREHADVVCVGGAIEVTCPSGIICSVRASEASHETIVDRLLAGDGQSVVHPTVMARRQAVLDVGGYREAYRLIEDIDLFLRLARIGRLANVETVVLQYRTHLGSTNAKSRRAQIELTRKLLDEAKRWYCGRTMPSPDFEGAICLPTDMLRGWGWNALRCGHRLAAMRYALGSLRRSPLQLSSYRLLACVVRGY